MGMHKRVKFPIEVTKGKASDLYRLKFIRRSELEPNVRHFMKHSVGQMGRQLDLWFKEQSFTLGHLSKEQEKVYESRKRLKKELRRIKKEEYVRYQEEIRTKLQDIRTKLITFKVIKKFKENVELNRQDRNKDMVKRPNVDFLRVPGNEEFMFGINGSNGGKLGSSGSKSEEHSDKKHKMITSATALTSFDPGKNKNDEDPNKIRLDQNCLKNLKRGADREGSELSAIYAGDYGVDDGDQGMGGMAIFGQTVLPRALSSRMETIPEENHDEVEVEIDDLREDPKLTKKRLYLFNRSQSKRNVFDGNDAVPLLPEVNTPRAHHVTRVINTDTEDKETQTSFGSGDKGTIKSKSRRSHNRVRKTIVVKLPGSSKSRHHPKTKDDDAKSSTGNFGSDPEYDDYDSVSDDNGITIEADVLSSDDEDWTGSDVSSETSTDQSFHENWHISLTRKKGKSSAKSNKSKKRGFKKTPETPNGVKTHFQNFPDDETFPDDLSLVYKQNPRSLQYKERSFYVAPDKLVRPSGSAKYIRTGYSENLDKTDVEKKEILQDIKNRRLDDIKRKLSRDMTALQIGTDRPIRRKKTPGEPNDTPSLQQKPGSRRGNATSMSVVTMNQKRAQASEWRRAHDLASSEPVQKYERTKSGRLQPLGSPRVAKHELPSMKDQYFRDKLLKAERDTIFNQNIKMKKFMDTFDKECVHADFPAITSHTSGRTGKRGTNSSSSAIGNFIFKIREPQTDEAFRQKVVPGVSTTSLRMLRNCRYLREYTPIPEQPFYVKETSWKMDNGHSKYAENYIANVRIQLF